MSSIISSHVVSIKKHHLMLDSQLIHEWFDQLDGRFWGITGVLVLMVGFGVSFGINPRLLSISGAFSDFGDSIRTAPYFTSSLLFAGYSLMHWRKYEVHTLRNQKAMSILFALQVISLALIALMPYAWHPWPSRIHVFAVTVLGISITSVMLLDCVMTLPQKTVHGFLNLLKIMSFISVLIGELIIFSSNFNWLNMTLIGEMLLISGYGTWIAIKSFTKVDNANKFKSLIQNLTL